MAKKYKLVPEALYQRMMHSRDEIDDTKALNILKRDIPPDLKVLLYADALRDVNIKRAKQREQPIVMEQVAPTQAIAKEDSMPAILNSTKAIQLYDFLKANGIGYNEQKELVVKGVTYPNTNLPMIVKGLTDSRISHQPGQSAVLNALPSMPHHLLSKTVVKRYMPTASPSLAIEYGKRKASKPLINKVAKKSKPTQQGAGKRRIGKKKSTSGNKKCVWITNRN